MLFIRRLRWDPGNVAHIARHGVTPEEVEQVCHGEPVVQQGYGGRVLVLGPTTAARMLTVVLDREASQIYYVVTARPSSRRERLIYSQENEAEG